MPQKDDRLFNYSVHLSSSFLATNLLDTRLNQVIFMTIVRQDGGGWPVQPPMER
jgi:hypothetical protein